MKKYLFVKQDGLKDCGVSCLSMIIDYYGGYIPIEKLRDMTKTTKNGVSAYNLINTANNIGLNASGVKVNNIDIDIKLPCIAFVTINKSYNHYVVIYEIDKLKKELVIADPASRIKKISFDSFYKIFNNVLLIFDFQNKLPLYTKPLKLSKFTINILKKYKKTFIKIILLSLFITLFYILGSFYIEIMINNYLKYNICLLSKIVIMYIMIYILKNAFEYIRNRLLLVTNKNIQQSLTNDMFSKIILLPYEYFKNRTTGEVISRINDLNIVSQTIIKVILTVILDLLLALFSTFFLIKISPLLFIISLIIFILYGFIVTLTKDKLNLKLEQLKEEESYLNSYITENINGFETIKGLSIDNIVINNYKEKNNKYLNNNYNYEKLYIKINTIKNIIDEIGIGIILFIGFILVIKDKLSLGNLLTYNALYVFFMNPIKNIIELSKDIKDAKISYKRINEIIFEDKEKNNYKNIPFNNIIINNLSYSYNNIDNILENININIKKNEKIMLIGNSGNGKSTILKILKKYYKINNNSIFIDSIDINKISKEEINNNITYVSQNEILFTDTLYNNLVLNRKVNNKQLNKVINTTQIDFIDKKLGLFMPIEENGFNLSGGEKQRIILARALLNEFKILILDESLSEVDINMERKILKKLFKKYNDKTIIIVSHRYNNLDLFDRVLKLENKKIEGIERNLYRKNISS